MKIEFKKDFQLRISVDKRWHCLAGRKAKLVDFSYYNIPTFESYKESKLKYIPDRSEKYTEDELKICYDNHLYHLKSFNGFRKNNELIDIIQTDRPDVVIFSSNWKGKLSLKSDLELWLWKEYDFSEIRSDFKCQMYYFENIELTEKDPELIFGGPTHWIASNSVGIYDVIFDNYKNPRRISFDKISGSGGSNGAIFEII